jgi:hypothetical protein
MSTRAEPAASGAVVPAQVEAVHLMPGGQEERDEYRTDVTAVAGHEDLHRAPPGLPV